MRTVLSLVPATLLMGIAFSTLPSRLLSQESGGVPAATAAQNLPEAPGAEPVVALNSPLSGQTEAGQGQGDPQSAPNPNGAPIPASSSAADQASDQQPGSEKTQHDLAEEQLKQQERQRVMGVMATFNTTSNMDAVPLSPQQKFKLFFKSSTDPWPFLLAGAVAGVSQANDNNPEWGQGAEGYAKRFGAAYGDAFIGNFFGNAVLPSLLHEDPRYFQKGTGSVGGRFLWAAASTVWCRRDNGKWGPNYANVGGNLIGAAIARAYYPESDRTVSDTITDGLTVSVEGIIGAEIIEFWPDMVRHFKHKQADRMARAQQALEEQTPKKKD